MSSPRRFSASVGTLVIMLMFLIAFANSALHWHSIIVLYALTAVLIAGIGVMLIPYLRLRQRS